MSAETSGWVWRNSPYDGATFLVHLALGDLANDAHEYEIWLLTKNLAEKARVSTPTARRALVRLVDDGYLSVVENNAGRNRASRYRFEMPDGRSSRSTGRSSRATESIITRDPVDHGDRPKEQEGELNEEREENDAGSLPLAVPDSKPTSKKEPDPIVERAREISSKVWERKNPRPATPFVGIVKIAEALLRAGHDPQAIGRAMIAVPTISTRWVEAEIARSSPSSGQPVDDDRSGESGRVDL